jgi:universal stress protein A
MAEAYRKILAAVDLSDDSHVVVSRALAMASLHGAELLLLHVVEYLPVEPMGEALLPSVPMTDELEASARKRFDALGERFRLSGSARQIVRTGQIKAEIVHLATQEQVDLIVLGSRERHGLAVILNLTEDTVLHAAPCDVLAVRLGAGQ